MSRRIGSASQIGFFGLNGAKVILGLTILSILDGIFGFRVFNYFLDNPMVISTPILAIIVALIIACANLLGIIVNEVIDILIITYWRGVNEEKLAKLRQNISQYVGQESSNYPIASIFGTHILFDGNMWNDHYIQPYKQEILTRILLILSCYLIIGFVIFFDTESKSLPLLDDSNIILWILAILTPLLLISFRIKSESIGEEKAKKIVSDAFLFILSLILTYSLYPLSLRLSESYLMDRNIDWKICWLILYCFILLLSSSRKIMIVLREVIHEIRLGIYEKSIEQKRLFGEIRKDQWYDLIVYYYDFFFHRVDVVKQVTDAENVSKMSRYLSKIMDFYVFKSFHRFFMNKRRMSKTESYLSTITGVYVFKLIFNFFVNDSNESKINTNHPDYNPHDIVRATTLPLDLDHIRQFNKTIDLVVEELKKENLDRAVELYNALDDQILVYFALGSYIERQAQLGYDTEQKTSNRLIEAAVLHYEVKSEVMPRLLSVTDSEKVLERQIDRYLAITTEGESSDNMNLQKKGIHSIAKNPYCSADLLLRILREYKQVDMITLQIVIDNRNVSSICLAEVASNIDCGSQLLNIILDKSSGKITVGVLLFIVSNGECRMLQLEKILYKHGDKISHEFIQTMKIMNGNYDKDILKKMEIRNIKNRKRE